MSSTYPINTAIFETARAKAKERAARHWDQIMTDPLGGCMWKTYHSQLNPNWFDPWHEHELSGIFNEAPDWEQTQNIYMVWCWLRGHGYNNYTIAAIIASSIHESSCTGGVWELRQNVSTQISGQLRTHPYHSLLTFEADSQNGKATYSWYYGGNPMAYEGEQVTWTASALNEETGLIESLTAPAGSWTAMCCPPLKMEAITTPDGIKTKPVHPLQFVSLSSLQRKPMSGYGFVQFTDWTKLPGICKDAWDNGNGDPNFEEAAKHWQLSLTLQLMIFERQRYVAMHTDPSQQTGPGYWGEWTNTDGPSAGFWWPPVEASWNYHAYGQNCTWDQFASGSYLPWVNSEIDGINWGQYVPPDIEAQGDEAVQQWISDCPDWYRIATAMSLWRVCYIHSPYADHGYRTFGLYALRAFEYWDAHGGPDIRDVPRARDLPHCELDQYHITYPDFTGVIIPYIAKRRNKAHGSTILLRSN